MCVFGGGAAGAAGLNESHTGRHTGTAGTGALGELAMLNCLCFHKHTSHCVETAGDAHNEWVRWVDKDSSGSDGAAEGDGSDEEEDVEEYDMSD